DFQGSDDGTLEQCSESRVRICDNLHPDSSRSSTPGPVGSGSPGVCSTPALASLANETRSAPATRREVYASSDGWRLEWSMVASWKAVDRAACPSSSGDSSSHGRREGSAFRVLRSVGRPRPARVVVAG